MHNLEKFHLLEEKIHQTVDRVSRMEARAKALQHKNQELEEEVIRLRKHANELSQQIVRLKTAREKLSAQYGSNEEIKKRIDRMLEKFGELQI
ncbi:MAG: cell division protein ZapB [Candidatus Latescibacteria bacterium]|nr:cell division protein ZapB [Candidatus Latescibacterota bacterium]NIM65696.1 cell division protein ZapB [Candidatus Latescibacterota bacterium]NIO02078.1 cell division protein ZapB [Candidatus Latescibacterota bacterium]NIO28890.1 cell division protein ZapB [Candidatus Latescibacterota bacterium]NIO56515.1 cell division protein ZapB [Candidatus Latescibacterota bacterium]